jgi:hypothetical protein
MARAEGEPYYHPNGEANSWPDYETPLLIAISDRKINAVKVLLALKADPSQRNSNNVTPLQLAQRKVEGSDFEDEEERDDVELPVYVKKKELEMARFSAWREREVDGEELTGTLKKQTRMTVAMVQGGAEFNQLQAMAGGMGGPKNRPSGNSLGELKQSWNSPSHVGIVYVG